jgi:hypothetical protein
VITDDVMKDKIIISLYNLLNDNPNILTAVKHTNRLSDKGFKDYFEQKNPDVSVKEFGVIKFYKLIEDLGIRWYRVNGIERLTGNKRYFSDSVVTGQRTIVFVTELYRKTQFNFEDYKNMFEQMVGYRLAPDATLADYCRAMEIETQKKKKEMMDLIASEARKSKDGNLLRTERGSITEEHNDAYNDALMDGMDGYVSKRFEKKAWTKDKQP